MIQDQLLLLRNRQINTEIALTRALGGGYQAPTADAVAETK